MHLIYQQQREILVSFITRLAIEIEEVAHGKGIGPQVTPWNLTFLCQSGKIGKFSHNFNGHG
jgi:hypothetical protein